MQTHCETKPDKGQDASAYCRITFHALSLPLSLSLSNYSIAPLRVTVTTVKTASSTQFSRDKTQPHVTPVFHNQCLITVEV